ncbi:hypothetical protein DFQ27_004052 [Actinomortierella ambigua]|uniref:Cytochrome c oxidase assembly protein n=1 Tax=Actinomortierella ambigua TaxID=1343610 RepID=A0A9P6U521_9FUNG|nr:hypothetical protein DFQ27_004052 [Actinomortierella ambigua]
MITSTKFADLAHRTFILGLFGATVYISIGTVQLVNARMEKNRILRETYTPEQLDEIKRLAELQMEKQRLEQQARREQA